METLVQVFELKVIFDSSSCCAQFAVVSVSIESF